MHLVGYLYEEQEVGRAKQLSICRTPVLQIVLFYIIF